MLMKLFLHFFTILMKLLFLFCFVHFFPAVLWAPYHVPPWLCSMGWAVANYTDDPEGGLPEVPWPLIHARPPYFFLPLRDRAKSWIAVNFPVKNKEFEILFLTKVMKLLVFVIFVTQRSCPGFQDLGAGFCLRVRSSPLGGGLKCSQSNLACRNPSGPPMGGLVTGLDSGIFPPVTSTNCGIFLSSTPATLAFF